MGEFKFFFTAVVSIVLLVGLVTVGIVRTVHHFEQSECAGFGQESGRQVKFVDYNFLSWGCLTPQADGRWIPVKQLVGVGGQ